MVWLGSVWLLLAIFILSRMIYQVWTKSFTWSNFTMNIQSPAIGLMIFPPYLGANQVIQKICISVGIFMFAIAFFIILKQSGMFKIKVKKS